jgi:hypothetical protein
MKTMLVIACSLYLLLLSPLASRASADTPAPGPYYYMSDGINPNRFPWGLNDRFGGLPIVENLTLLGTLLGDVPVPPAGKSLVPTKSYSFPKPNGNSESIILQPFAYMDGTTVRALPLGDALRQFLDDPLQGADFDLTLPFVSTNVALSDSSALLRVQRQDGSILVNNNEGVWHTAIDFDYNGNTSVEFDVIAAADGIVAGNLVSDCGPTESVAIKHTAANGTEFLTLYGHLEPLSKAALPVGTAVARGQKIGRLKRSDNYAHLHFAVAVRGPRGAVGGKAVPAMWYTIDPFGVYDYRRTGSDYTYLPSNTLSATVQPVRHAYVFRTNPVNASFHPKPPAVAALHQRVAATRERPRAITLRVAGSDAARVGLPIVSPPTRGGLSGMLPNLTYTPSSGFAGQDQFQFRAQSPVGSADATVTVEVKENSSKPIAAAQTRQPWANNVLVVPLDGTDRDHDDLTVVAVAAPLNGAVVYHGNVACYTPNLNYLGPDSFSFRVTDGFFSSSTKTVSLTVRNGFTVGTWSGLEGNSGSRQVPFIVRLLAPHPSDVSVSYTPGTGTATAPDDYVVNPGSLYFPVGGPTQAAVWATVKGDTNVEDDETFVLKLKTPVGGPSLYPSPADAIGNGTIRNDDASSAGAGDQEAWADQEAPPEAP